MEYVRKRIKIELVLSYYYSLFLTLNESEIMYFYLTTINKINHLRKKKLF